MEPMLLLQYILSIVMLSLVIWGLSRLKRALRRWSARLSRNYILRRQAQNA